MAQSGETLSHKLSRKTKEAPFVPMGIAGLIGAVAYGAYAYKNRGEMSTSVYLMHLRVRAQAMVVGAMTCGVAYYMIKDWFVQHGEPTHHGNGKK